MTMSSIVLIGISIIVTASHAYIKKGTDKIRLQQDFSLIESILANSITQSTYSGHGIYKSYKDYKKGKPTKQSGSCLKLTYLGKKWRVIYRDKSDFKILYSDSKTTNLVQDVVTNLVFKKQANAIETSFTLSQGGEAIQGSLVNAFRN